MASAQITVTIERPISEVFQFVLNGENNKIWRPTVMDVKNATGGPISVGTVFVQGMRAPNGMRINADYEITEIDKDRKIMFKVLNGPYRAIGTFNFETHESNTNLTFTMTEETDSNSQERTQHLQNVVKTLLNLKEHFKNQE